MNDKITEFLAVISVGLYILFFISFVVLVIMRLFGVDVSAYYISTTLIGWVGFLILAVITLIDPFGKGQ